MMRSNKPARNLLRSVVRQLVCAGAIAWAVAASPLILFAPPSFNSTAKYDADVVSTGTYEGRMAVFDDVWSTISERYYDRSFKTLADGNSWENQRAMFRSLAEETSSGDELYVVLRRMIASLNDPHTRVFSPSEKFDWWRPRFVTIGLTVKEIDGLPTVVRVEHGSAPQRAGIVPGDVIVAVNDQPAISLVQKNLSNAVASAPVRSRAFATLIDGPADSFVEIRWKRKDGRNRTAQFKRYWQQRELGLRFRRESGDIAVIELDAFTGKTSQSFATTLKQKLNKVRGIVLDLRGNGGGDAEAMTDIASAFLGSGHSLGKFIDRSGMPFAIMTRQKSPLIADRLMQTNAALVVLTSERTSSAAEIFVAGMKAAGRAAIVGTETCGCVLAIRSRHELPDGGLLDISELDYQTADGNRLEKNGIKPDEKVMVDRDDLYSGRDRAMQLALSKIRQRPVTSTQ